MHIKLAGAGRVALIGSMIIGLWAPRPCIAVQSPPSAAAAVPATHVDHAGLKKLAWQQACQATTFSKQMPVLNMIDLLHRMSFHHIELAPGQALSEEHKDVRVGHDMTDEQAQVILDKLKELKLDVVSYGPVQITEGDEAGARKVLAFAKKFKAKNVVLASDPGGEAIQMLDRLGQEYGINIGIINGAESTRYASPEALLQAVRGCSRRVGACADLANWRRSGRVPADCIRALGERVIEVHLDDVNEQMEEVALGEGAVDVQAVLQQLAQQQFKGVFAVEYTGRSASTQELLEDFARATNAFNAGVSKAAATVKEK